MLFSFAVAQPLYDLLAQNAEFFVARKSEPLDVVVLAVVLSFAIPAIAILGLAAIRLLDRGLFRALHLSVLTVLAAAFALLVLKRILQGPGQLALVIAIASALIFTIAYVRSRILRQLLTLLSPSILLFPALFVGFSPATEFFLANEGPKHELKRVNATAPVVLIVFDALSSISLLDEDGQIDPIRYPNMARLAAQSFWYLNATAVSDYTHLAVPAILTGRYPDRVRLPNVDGYPDNLFTLLGGSYDLRVSDPNTDLAPSGLSSRKIQSLPFVPRLRSLAQDLAYVYLHVLLPVDFATRLPPVDRNWKDFGTAPGSDRPRAAAADEVGVPAHGDLSLLRGIPGERPAQFRAFIDWLDPANGPTVYYIHSVIPHEPYRYLPSGKEYTAPSEYKKIRGLKPAETWSDDEFAVIQAHQRYLLQLGFVDRLLGAVLARLRSIGLFDASLIAVTADHGVSFRPGDKRRPVTQSNHIDIMSVPLLIKIPEQQEGIVSQRPAETVDILPTIADVLNVEVPWPLDGHSLLESPLRDRTHQRIFQEDRAQEMVLQLAFEVDPRKRLRRSGEQLSLFGSGDLSRLFQIGPQPQLIGQSLAELAMTQARNLTVELDNASAFDSVQPSSPFIPTQIVGRLTGSASDEPLALAIAVNGTIRATTHTYPVGPQVHEWVAVVPEESFVPGANEIELAALSSFDGDALLSRIRRRSEPSYSLGHSASGQSVINVSDGRTLPIRRASVQAILEQARIHNHKMRFSGWAVDAAGGEPASALLLFVDGVAIYSGVPTVERPDVARASGKEAAIRSGFDWAFPVAALRNPQDSEVRLFALSRRGVAAEFHYPEGYEWKGRRETRDPSSAR